MMGASSSQNKDAPPRSWGSCHAVTEGVFSLVPLLPCSLTPLPPNALRSAALLLYALML